MISTLAAPVDLAAAEVDSVFEAHPEAKSMDWLREDTSSPPELGVGRR